MIKYPANYKNGVKITGAKKFELYFHITIQK